MAPALRARFPDRVSHAVDNSPAMLDKARALGLNNAPLLADAATWQPDHPPAMIFSNARQYAAPSHALLRQIAGDMF